jgi:hypothetical protein
MARLGEYAAKAGAGEPNHERGWHGLTTDRLGQLSARHWVVVSLLVGLLTVAPASTAQGFSGPWDAGHEPPTITNPGVAVTTSSEGVVLSLSPSLWCPDRQHLVSLTVIVSEPGGSESTTAVSKTAECEAFLGWEWQDGMTDLNVDVSGVPGSLSRLFGDSNAKVTFKYLIPGEGPASKPLFYQLIGPSGVMAQGAWTEMDQPAGSEGTEHKNHNITECQRKHLDIISGPGGEQYCVEHGSYEKYNTTFAQGGWPAAPSQPKPKPKYVALTLRTAGIWSEQSAWEWSKSKPAHFRASHCKSRPKGRYRCNVSWAHGWYSFAGTAEVGDVNVYSGHWNYGLWVVRTNVRTHQHRRFTVRY